MNFAMFLILYKFLKDALQGGAPSSEAWQNLESALAEESAGFRAYLRDR